jgi:FO synthase subunit 1
MDKSIVTYSRSVTVNLSKICFNRCAYCGYVSNKLDQTMTELAVPYHAIKMSQGCKSLGVKEVNLVSGERPDKFAAVRARLDQWGFTSFAEYIYTVAELVFLEGLFPNIDVGYLTKEEMLFLKKIVVSVTVMLDTVDEKLLGKYSPNKSLTDRIEMIKSAGEIKMPVTSGILVGIGESQKSRKDALELIRDLHLKSGCIQNVVIQNFIPMSNTPLADMKPPSKLTMLETVALAKKILPEDIVITVPAICNKDIISFIKEGVHDIGRFDVTDEREQGINYKKTIKDLETKLKPKKLKLQRRLPIFSKYIVNGWYSRKTAQLLDKYKILLKNSEDSEHEQEDEE